MPRTWVDDLEGWTQIAPPPAIDGLTTCTTHTVAQQLVLTGLLLLFIFLMMNFNGLWPLAQDGSTDPLHSSTVAGEQLETWPELMKPPGCGTRSRFYTVKEEKKIISAGLKSRVSPSAKQGGTGCSFTLIHIMLQHTSYQEYATNTMSVPSFGKYGAALLLFFTSI